MKHIALLVFLAASAFAADTNRIKDLATTATSPASGDYLVIDGATNGTRKILASNILANTSATAGTYGNATQIPVITVNAKGQITAIANNTATGGSGGGGSGTVTSVSVTTANGVSGTVATADSTPAITLSLGAITPTSVNSVVLSGASTPTLAVTGTTAVSGTNTGDQNLFGNILVSGQTTVTANATAQNLTLVAGGNVTITTDNTTKSITIAASGGGGGGNTSSTTTMTANNVTVGAGTTNVKTSPVTINTTSGDTVTAGNITGNVGTFTTGNYVTLNATTLNVGNANGLGNVILSNGTLAVAANQTVTSSNNVTFSGGANVTHTNLGVVDATWQTGTYTVATSTNLSPAFVTETDGATVTITCYATKAVQNSAVTLAGNRTLAFTDAVDGMTGVIKVIQDATGSRTLTLPANSKVIGGGSGAITLTTTANAVDVLTWVRVGTNYYWTYGKNFN